MWMLFLAPAHAGTLSFHAASPVGLKLDAEWVTHAGTDATVLDVAPGRHRVEVCDLLGKVIAFEDVLFGDGPVRLEYDDRVLRMVDPDAEPADPAEARPPISAATMADLERDLVKGSAKARLTRLREVAAAGWFQMRHVDSLMSAFEGLDDRVEVARILAPRTLDPQNAGALDDQFPDRPRREQVRALFAH